MAFRVLSSNELELLTEKQRINYEKELDIYNERIKFVEQLEKFENAVIAPYEPKFINISAVKKPPEKIYHNQEVVVKMADIAVKSVPTMPEISFAEPITAKIPKCPKIKNVSIYYKKAKEYNKPVFPEINKAVAPVKTFIKSEPKTPVLPEKVKTVIPNKITKKVEQVIPKLPTTIKLQGFVKMEFAPTVIDNEKIKINKPNIMIPTINLSALTLPEKTQPILPHLSVNFKKIKAYKAPNKINISFKQENKTKVLLPKVSNISIAEARFNKPNIQKAKLPVAHKVVIPTKKFLQSEYSISGLHKPDSPKVNVQLYIAPEFQKAILPIFNKPVIISERYFTPLVDSKPKIEYPSINVISVKPFKKVQSKINGFPNVSAVNIPNVYENELLKNLLPSNKENDIRKGVMV